MYSFLIIFAIIACVGALVGTLMIAKSESNKIKKYEEIGDSGSSQLQRSYEYEKKSLTENLPLLAVIYGVAFLISFIVILIILFG